MRRVLRRCPQRFLMRSAIALLMMGALPWTVEAQVRVYEPARILPEARVELVAVRRSAAHVGAGVGFRAGRTFGVAALGTAFVAGADGADDARLELIGRFLLDPERRARMAFYAAGGAAALLSPDGEWRGVLVTMLGAELGRGERWGPFVEVGIGGGVRLAAGVRRR
jgi:hypothetical protein